MKASYLLVCFMMLNLNVISELNMTEWKTHAVSISSNITADNTGYTFDGTSGVAYDYGALDAIDGKPVDGSTVEYIFNFTDTNLSAVSIASLIGYSPGAEFNIFRLEQWKNTGKFGITIPGFKDWSLNLDSMFGQDVHMVWRRNNDTTMDVFINGVFIEKESVRGSSWRMDGGEGFIGCGDNLTSGVPTGNMFGVASYDQALTNSQIAALYEALSGEAIVQPPTVVSSDITDSSFKLTWDAVTGADDYTVSIATDETLATPLTNFPITTANLNIDIENLTSDTTYFYGIKTRKGSKYSIDRIGSVVTAYNSGTTDGVKYLIGNKWSYNDRWDITSVFSTNAKTNINNTPNASNAWYINQSEGFTIEAFSNSNFTLNVKTNDSWAGGKIWVDWNHDGIFDDSTEVAGYFLDDNGDPESSHYKFGSVLPNGGNSVTITVPSEGALPTLPFTTRIRVKAVDIGNLQPEGLLPDQNRVGQAHDYGLTITSPPSTNYATISASNSAPIAGNPNQLTLTAKSSTSTLASFTGEHDIRISGVEAAPNGTYGSFNNIGLTASARTGQIISVTFANGVATVPIILNHSGENNIIVEIKDLVTSGAYELVQGSIPSVTHAEGNSIEFMTNLNSTNNYNGGVFVPQPIIKLIDRFSNICTTDSSTQISAYKNEVNDPPLFGAQTTTINNGIATFTNLGSMNLSPTTLFDVAVKFENSTHGYEVISNPITIRGDAGSGGKCIELSGTQYIDLGHHTRLDAKAMQSVTIEAWLYLTELPSNRMSVIGSSDNKTFPGVNFGIDASGKLFFRGRFQGSFQTLNETSTNSIDLAKWQHVAFAYNNETKDFHFYIDGEDAGTLNVNAGSNNIWPKNIRYIGKSSLDGISNFVGKIDELRIWNVARSAEELKTNMYELTPTTRSSTTPLAYYRFDTSVGKYLSDYSSFTTPGEVINYSEDSMWVDSSFKLTPAIGLEITQTDNSVNWSVEDETGVKEYKIVNAETGKLIATVIAGGLKQYSYDMDEEVKIKLVVIDKSGFSQSFYPEDGNKIQTVYALKKGWNLLAPTGSDIDFQKLGKSFWSWSNGAYQLIEKPEVGQAFWVYSEKEEDVVLNCTKVKAELTLNLGWNMVGPTENIKIPDEANCVYSWESSYQQIVDEDILLQGIGYWIFSF